LTTEPTSVVRAGFEAVYAGRPLIVSDWPELRESFPHAVYARDDEAGIARAMGEAVERHAELSQAAPAALAHTRRRWAGQLAELRKLLELDPTTHPTVDTRKEKVP
jgi:hypothetical protein